MNQLNNDQMNELFSLRLLDTHWFVKKMNRHFSGLSHARLAQSVERETLNLKVVGSTPTSGLLTFWPSPL